MRNTKIIAEIGINHNGDLNIAKNLILLSKSAGCDFVKFQKRSPENCIPQEQRGKLKKTPWGEMTYLDYKKRIEFDEKDYDEIQKFCDNISMKFFVSVWDIPSIEFMQKYSTKDGRILKIPSALITNDELIRYARKNADILIISTGMSTEKQIDNCIRICDPDIIMHTNSTYPCPVEELNLQYLTWLMKKYPEKEIGYSGHEYGLVTTFATIPMGVKWIERHITLDRTMWGSDHSASIEPSGLFKLVKGIRDIEKALEKECKPRVVFGGELEKLAALRG